MGLDSLELILSLEEAFEIEISDEVAETLQSPKMVIEFITNAVRASNDCIGACPVMVSYHRIRQAFQSIVGLQRQQIQLNSKLRTLLPKSQRQEVWNRIQAEVGIPKWPTLGFGVGIIFGPITIRELIDWTVARYPQFFLTSHEQWTAFQVRSTVRAIVRDVAGVDKFKDNDLFRNFL